MIADQPVGPLFIPLKPSRRKLIAMMVINSIPGILLIISVVCHHPKTVGALLLSVICVISGIVVILLALRKYWYRGKSKLPGTDTVSIIAALLIIAQSSMMFDAQREFQLAHILFLAAAIYIFKGV